METIKGVHKDAVIQEKKNASSRGKCTAVNNQLDNIDSYGNVLMERI